MLPWSVLYTFSVHSKNVMDKQNYTWNSPVDIFMWLLFSYAFVKNFPSIQKLILAYHFDFSKKFVNYFIYMYNHISCMVNDHEIKATHLDQVKFWHLPLGTFRKINCTLQHCHTKVWIANIRFSCLLWNQKVGTWVAYPKHFHDKL